MDLRDTNVNMKREGDILKPVNTCPYCSISLQGQKSKLQTHIEAVHLKLKPFKCKICNTLFATKGNLKAHGLRSVAGLVIQATGRTEFEESLRPGSPGGVLSDNPSIRTSSLVTPVL